MTPTLLIGATLLALGGLAAAQGTAPPASAAKKELAQKVVQLQQGAIDRLAQTMVEQPAAALMQQAGPVLQQRVAADRREAVGKEIQADVRKYVDEATPIVRDAARRLAPGTFGPMLEEKFSEDELRQLIAALEMLQSPAMRKLQQQGGEFEKSLGQKLAAETRPQVEPKLRALQDSMAKRLGLPAAGAEGSRSPASPPAAAPRPAGSAPRK